MRKIVLLHFYLLMSKFLLATHISGGFISYQHISGLDYKLKLTIYHACQGPLLPSSSMVEISSTSLSTYSVTVLPKIDSGEIHSFCPSVGTLCSSPAGVLPGFKYFVYEDTITLSGQAADWRFKHQHCCRNNSIVNLQNPGLQDFTVNSLLNNSTALGGMNNSVQHLAHLPLLYTVGQPHVLHATALDPDGDSLVYHLASVMNGTTAGTYATGYSASNPFGPGSTCSINTNTGDLSFQTSLLGTYVVAYTIDEYRNGVLIGSTLKDFQVSILNGTNQDPVLSGINGGSATHISHTACPASSLSFTVHGTDADLSDSVHLEVLLTDIPAYTLTSNGALQETVTFDWAPTSADVRPQPYYLVIKARDNSCATTIRLYQIYVNACNTDSVWAGDANADFTANNSDVLSVGIAYGTNGIVRPAATSNWVAEYCPNWSSQFVSGVNFKHADCNGDGIIDSLDLIPISLNYGMIHLKEEPGESQKTAGYPDLKFDHSGITATPGTTIHLPLMLGNASTMLQGLYGLALQVVSNISLAAPMQLQTPISWLGNMSDILTFSHEQSNQQLDIALVRKNQIPVNGGGQIATISVPIDPGATPGSLLILELKNSQLIESDGNLIQDYNIWNDTLIIAAPNSVSLTDKKTVQLFPNPVQRELQLSGITEDKLYRIMDLSGRIMQSGKIPVQHQTIHVKHLTAGPYIIELISTSGGTTHRFQFLKQ